MYFSTENPHCCVNKQLQISFAQLFLLSWVCNQFGASKSHLLRPQECTQLLIFTSNSGLAPRVVACGPKSLNQFVVTSGECLWLWPTQLQKSRFFSVKYCFLNHHLALQEIDWGLKLHYDPEFQIQALPKEDNAGPEAECQWGDPLQIYRHGQLLAGLITLTLAL